MTYGHFYEQNMRFLLNKMIHKFMNQDVRAFIFLVFLDKSRLIDS